MKTIRKYQLHVGHNDLPLAVGSETLSVHVQGDKLQLWVLEPEKTRQVSVRQILVCQTGTTTVYENLKFLGTVLLMDGRYVAHAFEVL